MDTNTVNIIRKWSVHIVTHMDWVTCIPAEHFFYYKKGTVVGFPFHLNGKWSPNLINIIKTAAAIRVTTFDIENVKALKRKK